MKIYVIYLTATSLLGFYCSGEKITVEDFTWKLIEKSWNATKTTENFAIAPHEAYLLYKELFNISSESSEEDTLESDNSQDEEPLVTALPVIRKQQKSLTTQQTNQTDLLSIISLTARWSFNFQTRDTHKRVFHQFGRPNQKMWLDFLRKDDTFYYIHDEQLNASILELPLNIKQIKLIIILPDQEDGLQDLKEYLLANVSELGGLINKTHKMLLVRVLLPKFHLTYKINLSQFFEKVSSRELDEYENVYQVSNLEFNERGIGRFEKTTVLFWNSYSYLRVSPKIFDVCHPFLFLIADKGGVQFFGQVVKMQH